jgi:hypothetical protein
MKRFFIKILIFTLLSLIIAIMIESVVRGAPNPYKDKISLIEKHKKDVQLLVLGSSTTLNGINPSVFDKKTLNMALGGQGITIDAFLVNRYLKQMPNLEAIILPVDYSTLFKPAVSGFPDGLMSYHIYYGFEPDCFSIDNCFEFFHRKSVRIKLEKRLRGNTPKLSNSLGFAGSAWVGPLEAEVYIKGMTIEDHTDNQIDKTIKKDIKALHQIAELSDKANVKLVIVSMPFHKSFRNLASSRQWSFTHSVIDSVINQYNNCQYFDYYSTDFPDTCYLNSTHLNIYGAELFTTMLAHELDTTGVFQN